MPIDESTPDMPTDSLPSQPEAQLVANTVSAPVRMLSNADMEKEEQRKAELSQQKPAIQDIALYVRNAWTEAASAKREVEERMLKSLRQRRGEYEAQKLDAIKAQGGSEIFMMLTSVKCRAAASWLRDSLLGTKENKPWTLTPTPLPDLPRAVLEKIHARIMAEIQDFLGAGGIPPTEEMVITAQDIAEDRLMAEQSKAAKKAVKYCEDKMEDQLVEGGFEAALHEFIDDIVTYPTAFLKGPVLRKKPRMTWGDDGEPVLEEKIVWEWERVDPLNIYPSRQSRNVHDGFLIEIHHLSRADISMLKGVEGYNDEALTQVLMEYMNGGLNEWLSVELDTSGKSVQTSSAATGKTIADVTIDAIQFWGHIPGKLLTEWGLEGVEDKSKDYSAEVWLIGRWVIKAVLNPDPLQRRPYFGASYEMIPGHFWGHGVTDLVRDCQNVCNAAARSLVNNMGFASGPQMWVNVDRLADGEEITQLVPWKIHQGKSDPMGGSGPPVGFFQPNSLSHELMSVYEKFSNLADEYSGVPKYMTGTQGSSGAGRTASGLSMMINNAGKAIKQVLSHIDASVLTPLLEYLFYYNMRYSDDPKMKNGDILIKARGASGLIAKESQQVRLNEFLGLVINNQTVSQIIGPEGIAALLRQGAEQLDLDTDKIVPSEELLRAEKMVKEQEQRAMEEQQQDLMERSKGQPVESISFNRGPDGEMTGMDVRQGPNPQDALMDGSPVTNNMRKQ